jgi:hypothetical protein
MDRDVIEQRLVQAEVHVAMGLQHIARQHALIAELRSDPRRASGEFSLSSAQPARAFR